MRITKIKLSGFKSFVDPTTLTLPGNLTGVVGPNGCGKSNIIDALMWVMGESSAKHLRGDSMADVIFNGSNSRKPVGQASVELVFDNSDGALGGQYAGYGEIAIKRSIGRDGVSSYQLNGTRCRRKDVTNVFLGTGLGSHGGYSVIEQGMISRVVEAKPEELRGFLEEAAGISKYKERRRETVNRIRHTKENLERLDDIREEITKQLAHLQRQAKAAERYQTLKQDERLTDAQLLALRWRGIDKARTDHARTTAAIQNKVEAAVAELRSIEVDQTTKRDQQTAATDAFNKVQSDFYAKSAEISRLEQALAHSEERKTSLAEDLRRTRASLDEINRLLETDQTAITSIDEEIGQLEPDLDERNRTAEKATQRLEESEQSAEDWQREWDAFNLERAEAARLEHAEQVRLEHLQEGITGARARMDGLYTEQRGISTVELESTIDQLRHKLRVAEQSQDELLVRRDTVKTDLQDARSRTYHHGDELHDLRTKLETLRGKQAALVAMQDAALGQDQSDLQAWLQDIGLHTGRLLADEVDIERGWEAAVEMALKVPLSAICQQSSIKQVLAADSANVPAAIATFIDTETVPVSDVGHTRAKLSDKVRSEWGIESLLAGVYVADSVTEAQAQRVHLGAHESVITRDGYWLGPNWVQLCGNVGEQAGILERARSIDELDATLATLDQEIHAAESAFDAAQTDTENGEERETDVIEALAEAMSTTTELKTELARQESALERQRERAAAVKDEIGSLEKQFHGSESAAATSQSSLQGMREKLAHFEASNAGLVASRATMQQQLDEARSEWRAARETRHEIALKAESLRSSRDSLNLAVSRNQTQRDELAGRGADLESAMVSAEQPQIDLRGQLERSLALRIVSENALTEARKTLATYEHGIRENDEARLRAERAVEEQRAVFDQARLEQRAIEVRLQELESRLEQTDFTLQTALDGVDDDADEAGWQERLDRIRNRIDRLGPINLAAIDEFSQLSERKEYLDQQNGDLTQALETLDGAIRKIDRETRTRFKETFDQVNIGMQTMFPTLFGGGHAYLELTGDDLLEAGVTVMARPPGKRNSNIHLLSGGEKALTALAFVFSLFELNPAPFCLLDEVDAPLDDANVVRLSKLLTSMAQRIQFICVTHNKITMEITEQLVGVTMQEPGVSRLVSVNMEEAVEMAAAS